MQCIDPTISPLVIQGQERRPQRQGAGRRAGTRWRQYGQRQFLTAPGDV